MKTKMFLFLVLSLFVVPNISLAAECTDEACLSKALIAYDRAVLKANDALFGAVMKIGSKYIVPAAVNGTPIPAQADDDWRVAADKFVVAHQKAAAKLFSQVPQVDAILLVGVSFESLTSADFLFDEADQTAGWIVANFLVLP